MKGNVTLKRLVHHLGSFIVGTGDPGARAGREVCLRAPTVCIVMEIGAALYSTPGTCGRPQPTINVGKHYV